MPWASGDALTSTNLNAKSGVVYNVKEYGALGNGLADDTAAIVAAIAAAGAAPNKGAVVYFPSGTYNVSSVLDLTLVQYGAISLVGAGKNATIISSSVTSGAAINAVNSANGNTYLAHFSLVQSGGAGKIPPATTRAGNYGIRSTGATSAFVLDDVLIWYFGDSGVYIEGASSQFTLRDVAIAYCAGYGLTLTSFNGTAPQDALMIGGSILGCYGGILVDQAASCDFVNVDIELRASAQFPALHLKNGAQGNSFTGLSLSVGAVPTPAALVYLISARGNTFTGCYGLVTVAGVDNIACDGAGAIANNFIGGTWSNVSPAGGYYANMVNNAYGNLFANPNLVTFTASRNLVNDNGGCECTGVGTVLNALVPALPVGVIAPNLSAVGSVEASPGVIFTRADYFATCYGPAIGQDLGGLTVRSNTTNRMARLLGYIPATAIGTDRIGWRLTSSVSGSETTRLTVDPDTGLAAFNAGVQAQHFISATTLNASGTTSSIVTQGLFYFSVLSNSTNGAEFGIRSGNTVWRFASVGAG